MIEIINRYTKEVLYKSDVSTVREAIQAAVEERADLRNADLRCANLSYADLRNANLRDADLRCANLSYADLRNANLSYANLRDANLSRADLRCANLRNADLSDADLRDANLSGADLRGADLRNADLHNANLRGAYLRGADLRCANLSDAKGLNKHLVTDLLMLLDQPAEVRAYKLVTEDLIGPFNGGIRYEVGASYEVDGADCDDSVDCGAGINLATLPWCMKEWRKGYRILIAEFTAADIAAIPVGTDGKFRVHRCKIVGEKNLVEIGLVEHTEEVEADK